MSLAQARKAVVSAIFVAGAAAALILSDYDPTFTETVVALSGSVFGLIGVFASKNVTPDDLSKAVSQLQAAAITVVGYWTVIPTGTVAKVSTLTGALVAAYFVYRIPNDEV